MDYCFIIISRAKCYCCGKRRKIAVFLSVRIAYLCLESREVKMVCNSLLPGFNLMPIVEMCVTSKLGVLITPVLNAFMP